MPEVTFFDETWTIEASAPEVFDLLADVEGWPEWTSAITSASRSGTGDLSHGDTITFTPNSPLAIPLSTTVREVTKPNRISWGVRIPGFNLEHRFEISKKGQGCEVRQVEFAEGLLAPSLLPFKGLFQSLDQTWGDDLAAHIE